MFNNSELPILAVVGDSLSLYSSDMEYLGSLDLMTDTYLPAVDRWAVAPVEEL